ncbi:MAG: hypothetical protein WBA07_20180 [Rivularia sp. (in: cyanobacteria)]
MSKIQINDVQLDGAEQFNDSETFLNELHSGEMEQIFGGLTIAEVPVFDPEGPFPVEPIHPIEPKPRPPVKPIVHYPIELDCWYHKKLIKDEKVKSIEFFPICPVIL